MSAPREPDSQDIARAEIIVYAMREQPTLDRASVMPLARVLAVMQWKQAPTPLLTDDQRQALAAALAMPSRRIDEEVRAREAVANAIYGVLGTDTWGMARWLLNADARGREL